LQANTLRVAVWVGTVGAFPDLTVSNKIKTSTPMSELGRGCVKTLTLDLRVELPSRFRRCENQLHWQHLSEEGN